MKALVYILVFAATQMSYAGDSKPDQGPLSGASDETRLATHVLLARKTFCFGQWGLEQGAISPGELAFRIIYRQRNAAGIFSMILSAGTPEAKLYALTGLFYLDRPAFTRFADEFRTHDSKPLQKLPGLFDSPVAYQSGDVIMQHDMADIIHRVENGNYESFMPARPKQ